MEAHPERHFREVLFLCDEYQHFATVGESDRPAMRNSSASRANQVHPDHRNTEHQLAQIRTAR